MEDRVYGPGAFEKVVGAQVSVELTTVHAAFDDDEDNVGTHDLVKDLTDRGFAIVDADLLERRLLDSRARLVSIATQLEALAKVTSDAGYRALSGELSRIAEEARHA